MPREIIEPTVNEHGFEQHPAWALIGASRVSATPGAVLFDSDIRHNHFVTIRISTASRARKLGHDYLHAGKQFIEVAMSEAQWASFVSSMNAGQGVPCTVERVSPHGEVPGFPYEPRLRESMDEVRGAADKMLEHIKAKFEAVKAKPNKGNIRDLEIALQNATPNVTYAAKTLVEHGENVVQRARADIEAMVVHKAQQLGLEPGDLGIEQPALEAGDDIVDGPR